MNSFKGKKVLVFGLGLNQGGVGTAKFFARNGAEVKVTDLKSKEILQPSIDQLKEFRKITYTLGEHKNEDIDWADLIIKNPAIKPGNPYVEYALQQGKQVEQDMGIFLQFVSPEQIIGITGTKGKSTTASLIYEVLKNSGKEVVFAGNIGRGVLDTIEHVNPHTLVVLEISSFQLEAFRKHQLSPKYAVITNIYPDHLNYYKSMEEYIAAKRVISLYQTPEDLLFINKDDSIINSPEFLSDLKGQLILYSSSDLPAGFKSKLIGEHNKSNMAVAFDLGKSFGIDENLILETLKSFKGVPFRMELIKEWHGIKIYNDTTATGPDAGVQALKTFPGCILIAGGMNKNMPYEEYGKIVDQNAKAIFFLEGDATDLVQSLLVNKEKIKGTYNNLEELLKDVKEFVKPGDLILFSPAATSFNLFQNEFDRGRKFNEAVKKVFQ